MTLRIWHAVRLCRAACDWTQAELGSRASLGAPMIALIEQNKREPSLAALERIVAAFQIPMMYFLLLASDRETRMPLCESCRVTYRRETDELCEQCQRRRRYGVIVEALSCDVDEPPFARSTLDALDALADIMADRHRLIRSYQRELREESRAAQRDARDAYTEGRLDQARDGAEW